jgi:hypothetical protein
MAARSLVVIGGSAGALEPLRRVIERLPADFPGTILVTIHLSPHSPGHLAEMLSTTTGIPVSYATDGQRIQPGRVLVAPPDRHLVVEDGIVRLSNGPRENRSRPAIDPMFRSAAVAYREGVVAVLLSGLLDDGADGMIAVKRAGGCAIVQDPAEAAYPDMPQAALRHAEVDEVLAAAAIGPRLVELSREEAEPVAAAAGRRSRRRRVRARRPRDGGSSLRVRMPGLPRRVVGAARGFPRPLPVPHRPRLLGRERRGRHGRGRRAGALGGAAGARGEGRPRAQAHGGSRRRGVPIVTSIYGKRLREAEENARALGGCSAPTRPGRDGCGTRLAPASRGPEPRRGGAGIAAPPADRA